ncbi:UDP-N-acetylmuramoyl-L-alanyl-D-glutamate--2,6-diaminopimelate ligase [Variovorax sp. VNK109]|uniref:UDP-N-acetylmuramoyl-L-alanyl-D-glutamate--2, 6-diaminopimelate ligase n=1 Tax=Variovorax sp. VNK109 TaxID=3400919 RepID=UPI003BFD7CEA
MQRLNTPAEAAQWLRTRVSANLTVDSRLVRDGDGFIAWPGFATDGRQFVGAARAQGATACLVELQGADQFDLQGDDIAGYEGLKAATGLIASAYFEDPSAELDVLAVTGTNGKTSTAWWLAQAISRLRSGAPCAVVGTLGVGVPPDVRYNGLTTPDPVLLQRTFRVCADKSFSACAIEASSIGIAERRLDGTRIRVAVFTNFTQDHLDYHASMDAYWQAKAELFRWPGLAAAVVNVDDVQGATLAGELGEPMDLWTFSAVGDARLCAQSIVTTEQGLRFDVVEDGQRHSLQTQLIGQYNVSNLLGVIGALRAMDVPLADAVTACTGLLPVPGRMQRVDSVAGQPLAVVDYAHTPDALDKALTGLRTLTVERGGRLWCVFGCGGDRDPVKRPMMGAVAEKCADSIVITSDNPRSEKPEAIVSQILLGLTKPEAAQVQVDRASAIADALKQAGAQDVVLIAGKGHEAWQEVAGRREEFSDVEHAARALAARSQEGKA